MEAHPVSDLPALATDAYVYGFPLVFDVDEVDRFTRTGMGAMKAAPVNTFSHAAQLAGPDDTFVSVNNDTIYSIAMLDLSAGPTIMNVPDTAGRYYVMQFVDAWTNNFAYVGRRATGTAAGRFLLTPPGWTGSVPPGLTRISCPDQGRLDRRPLGLCRRRRPPGRTGVATGRVAPTDGDTGWPRSGCRGPTSAWTRTSGSSRRCGYGCKRSRQPGAMSHISRHLPSSGCWTRPVRTARPIPSSPRRSGSV